MPLSQQASESYDRAVAYIRDYHALVEPKTIRPFGFPLDDFEKPLILRMSLKDWHRLCRQFGMNCDWSVHPRFSYNTWTSTLTIHWAWRTVLSSSIMGFFYHQLVHCKTFQAKSLSNKVLVVHRPRFKPFKGAWQGSSKAPDLGLQVWDETNVVRLKWVLQVGTLDMSDQLRDDVQLWLEGTSDVCMVTLVKFHEAPPYQGPRPEDLEALRAATEGCEFVEEHLVFEKPYGPVTIRGHQWGGEMQGIWVENWVRNAEGRAVRRGDAENLMRANHLKLDLGNVLPGRKQKVKIKLDHLPLKLQDSIARMAADRFADAIGHQVAFVDDRGANLAPRFSRYVRRPRRSTHLPALRPVA